MTNPQGSDRDPVELDFARVRHVSGLGDEICRLLPRGQYFRCMFDTHRGMWRAWVTDKRPANGGGSDGINDLQWDRAPAKAEWTTEAGALGNLLRKLLRERRGALGADASLRKAVVDNTGW